MGKGERAMSAFRPFPLAHAPVPSAFKAAQIQTFHDRPQHPSNRLKLH